MLSFKQHIQLDEGNPLARLAKHAEEGRHYAILSSQRPHSEVSPEQNKKNHE